MHQQIKQVLHSASISHKTFNTLSLDPFLFGSDNGVNVCIPNCERRHAVREICGRVRIIVFGSVEAVLLMCSDFYFSIRMRT